jgi:hypothetical protein
MNDSVDLSVAVLVKAVPKFWKRLLVAVPTVLSAVPTLEESSFAQRCVAVRDRVVTPEPIAPQKLFVQQLTWDGTMTALCRIFTIDCGDVTCVEVVIAFFIEMSVSGKDCVVVCGLVLLPLFYVCAFRPPRQ